MKPIGIEPSHDVRADTDGIQANAYRVFGPQENTDEPDTTDPAERILRDLDTCLSLGAGPGDIGEAPSPLPRFHGDKEA